MFVAQMGRQHEHVIIIPSCRNVKGPAGICGCTHPSDCRKMCDKLHAGEELILTSSQENRDKSNFELCMYPWNASHTCEKAAERDQCSLQLAKGQFIHSIRL